VKYHENKIFEKKFHTKVVGFNNASNGDIHLISSIIMEEFSKSNLK